MHVETLSGRMALGHLYRERDDDRDRLLKRKRSAY
jgi:hypothetical protein